MAIPSFAKSSAIASIWPALRRVIVVLTWTGNPAAGRRPTCPRSAENSFPAAKGVVGGCVGAVEADAQGLDAGWPAANASAVASGVADGVKATCSPRPTAWRINSHRSGRFSGRRR